MPYVVAAILAFGIVQFVWSVRLAYRIERYQLAAGYPILGHALHTACIVLLLAVLVPKDWQLPGAVRVVVAIICFALPIIHGWLLLRCARLGERSRLAAEGRC